MHFAVLGPRRRDRTHKATAMLASTNAPRLLPWTRGTHSATPIESPDLSHPRPIPIGPLTPASSSSRSIPSAIISDVMQPPADITLQVLERIQQSIVDLRTGLADLHDETRTGLADLGTRLDGVDTTLAEQGAILCVLQDHASATNEHLASLDGRVASLDGRVASLEHHATATQEVLGLLHTRLGFFECASTIATEGRARLEASVATHDARLTCVEARLDAVEQS